MAPPFTSWNICSITPETDVLPPASLWVSWVQRKPKSHLPAMLINSVYTHTSILHPKFLPAPSRKGTCLRGGPQQIWNSLQSRISRVGNVWFWWRLACGLGSWSYFNFQRLEEGIWGKRLLGNGKYLEMDHPGLPQGVFNHKKPQSPWALVGPSYLWSPSALARWGDRVRGSQRLDLNPGSRICAHHQWRTSANPFLPEKMDVRSILCFPLALHDLKNSSRVLEMMMHFPTSRDFIPKGD